MMNIYPQKKTFNFLHHEFSILSVMIALMYELVCRVEEVFQMLREAKYICETISSTTVYVPSYDEYPCDCFEYEMSGHCCHSLDDDVFL